MTDRRNISQKTLAAIPLISNDTQHQGVSIVQVQPDQDGQRLDNFLFKRLRSVPRTRIYRIIRKGEVRVNKKRAKPETRLHSGDQVRVPPLQLESGTSEKDPPFRLVQQVDQSVLFENEHLLVVNKPETVAVHAGSGLQFGIVDLVRRSREAQTIELVHRLDRDTSGCLMLAKSRKALLHFQQLLKQRQITKTYLAAVHGQWPADRRVVDLPLRKTLGGNAERRVVVDQSGKAAETRISRVDQFNDFSLLRLELITGRTHQIRVHCQQSGHAIIGDSKYGDAGLDQDYRLRGIKRLMLHAWRLTIPESGFNPGLALQAPEPQPFRDLAGRRAQAIFTTSV